MKEMITLFVRQQIVEKKKRAFFSSSHQANQTWKFTVAPIGLLVMIVTHH